DEATSEAEIDSAATQAASGPAIGSEGEGAAEAETATDSEGDAIMPGFVPTKASRSRLAFLSGNRAAATDLSAPDTSEAGEDQQMSIDDAIANQSAVAFGSGMPASPEAAPATEAKAGPEPVMVGDTADEVTAARKPFIPGAPATMPEDETVPDAAPAGGKTSLINKISRLWTEKPQEDATSERREPAVEAASVTTGDVAAEPAQTTAEAAPSILDLPRADAMNRVPEPVGTTTLDRPADDLEIPAFLRRQAN
ncbi:MAG: hypothetical protein VW619_02280, partial [Rhodobiaceae bacterium]